MSHGERGDIITDSEGQPVELVDIQDLLSPKNFPAMKGKPKLMIVQACSGGKYCGLWYLVAISSIVIYNEG